LEGRGLTLALRSVFPAGARPPREDEEVVDRTAYGATFELEAGQSAWFVFGGWRVADRVPDGAGDALAARCKGLFEETLRQWRRWLAKCTYRGCYREQVKRSALALKLMTFEPTGAVIAAPTASLPERIPGTRNWDYRFTFLRDAAFILDALMQIGFTDEADAFVTWLVGRITPIPPCWRPDIVTIPPCYNCADGRLMQPLYTIRGGTHLEGLKAKKETESNAYDGYRRSQPVRFGNAAAGQVQLDLYGELMDALYVYAKQRERFISFELWGKISTIVNWVCANWEERDRSIWEVRGPEQDFVFSKLMCWVAIDRGLRLADLRSLPAENYDTWRKARDRIYRYIMEKGWNRQRKTFVQTRGGTELDASSLLMPMVGFIAPNDDRIVTTIEAIKRPFDDGLMHGDLIYRYDWQKVQDLECQGAVPESEGTFNLCTFWLIEAMALTRRPDLVEEARVKFDRMLGYANHLGLYAEQTGARGEALGNFPQAFTHLGLIKAALVLDRALDGLDPTVVSPSAI
jgi:GH15 family glucan-1,4-alpha-glucosidase